MEPGNWKGEENRKAGVRQGYGQGKTAEQLTLRPLGKPHDRKVWDIYLLPAQLQSCPGFIWWKLRETDTTGLSPVRCSQKRLPELLTLPSSGDRSNERLRILFPSCISKSNYLKMECKKSSQKWSLLNQVRYVSSPGSTPIFADPCLQTGLDAWPLVLSSPSQ